jgi:hypothetical protein
MLCQSLVGHPPVEAIELDPGPELLELVAQVVDVVRTVADGFDDLDQPLGERFRDDPEPDVREKVAMALEVKPEAATSAGAGEAAGDIAFPTTMPT